jgi:hypothetical protein
LSGEAGKEHIRRGTHEFCRIGVSARVIATNPTRLDANVAALGPAALLQALAQRRKNLASELILRVEGHQHPDAPRLLALLRARRKRPCRRGGGEERDELSPSESCGANYGGVMRGLDPRIHLLTNKDGLHRNSSLPELRVFKRRKSGKPDLRCQAR